MKNPDISNQQKRECELIQVAMVGNPNSGKSTIFNRLTGERQHIGNYPGVTVDIKEGTVIHQNIEIRFTDLPGTYSLNTISPDELITRNFIIDKMPDLVLVVIDASNLDRNLYLASQVLELGVPVILAFNKWDAVLKTSTNINHMKISQLLGVPVIPTVGTTGEGLDELIEEISTARNNLKNAAISIPYGSEAVVEIEKLSEMIIKDEKLKNYHNPRWLALKLLENDQEIYRKIKELLENRGDELFESANKSIETLKTKFNTEPELLFVAKRYDFIAGITNIAVKSKEHGKRNFSDKVDGILTNQFLGIPIFLSIMWLLFQFTFAVGAPLMDMVETGQKGLSHLLSSVLADGWFKSLLIDGIIGGVGAVIIFLPNILLLFLGIAVLELSGYISRAAFVMDKIMQKLGLQGKSFVPMIIGFGCSVPAVMATRTLENKKDRLITMLVIPFMSCGAKLPVYILLTGAFFAESAGTVIFIIYFIGILTAIFAVWILRKFVIKGETSPFILELPSYKFPSPASVLKQTFYRGWLYIKKAGTIILGASIILWLILAFPNAPTNVKKPIENKIAAAEAKLHKIILVNPEIEKLKKASENSEKIEEKLADFDDYTKTANTIDELNNNLAQKDLEYSIGGTIGKGFSKILTPTGLGDWKIGTALLSGFAAKEIVVSTFGTLYSLGDEEDEESETLQTALQNDESITPLIAFSLMVFVLLYIPCMAVFAVVKAESSWKWAFFMSFYTTGIAWVASFIVYQGGRLIFGL
ncbi:MAG: ferrous iron transport protein B [Planctomycetes bacterium]|nr:ferrous iron transport protein B [Planctomycetota bacterium]